MLATATNAASARARPGPVPARPLHWAAPPWSSALAPLLIVGQSFHCYPLACRTRHGTRSSHNTLFCPWPSPTCTSHLLLPGPDMPYARPYYSPRVTSPPSSSGRLLSHYHTYILQLQPLVCYCSPCFILQLRVFRATLRHPRFCESPDKAWDLLLCPCSHAILLCHSHTRPLVAPDCCTSPCHVSHSSQLCEHMSAPMTHSNLVTI